VRPLEDVRIIAVEQYGAGPWATLQLADLGADVIKIEDPSTGGDVGRYVPPFQQGEDSLFFQSFNRNKRSLPLDISTPEGRRVFHDLVGSSDVVFSNLRGDVPAKIGLRYTDLREVNAQIVCVSLSAYGMTGPRSHEPGYDYMLQGLTGWMSLAGEPEGPPTKTGLSLVDFSGGFVAATAILAGVHAARRDGVGMDCDLSLFDTAISLLNYLAAWQLNTGYTPGRTRQSAHPSLVPFQNFETATEWIVVGCAKEKFFARLAAAVGYPELAHDPRFATFSDRADNAGALLEVLENRFRQEPAEHWLGLLREAGVPCAPINDVAQGLADPQTEARRLILELEHPDYQPLRLLASPVRVGEPVSEARRAPSRYEHLEGILGGLLGYDETTISELRERGAFGLPKA
jgi:crotonobetainyl-CoA:carnitine CoA-transferase CaiB-like acyl-CoA transferase